MYSSKLTKLPKNTFEVVVDIPWKEVEKEYEVAFAELLKTLEIEGFRKGKVPAALGKKHLTKDAVYQKVFSTLFPKIYDEVLKKEGLKPIVNPKLELVNAKENEAWQIKIKIAEKPLVNLGEYKAKIKKIKEGVKKPDIWVPGKDLKAQPPEDVKANDQKVLNAVLGELLKSVVVEISDLVVEDEVQQRIARLVDDIQKLGISVETYLNTKKMTQEQLRNQYRQEVEETYKLEFILSEVADKEGIKVEQSDLDKLFGAIKDEKEKHMAKENAYMYATVLRKQKTLDYLIGL